MTRHHILHILGTALPEGTGVARLVAAIADGIDPTRFKVHAWFLESDGPLATELASRGIPVRVVPWKNGVTNPAGMWRFYRQLRSQSFAIVHQHYGGRALRWIAQIKKGTRILVHLHGRIVENQGSKLAYPKLQGADFVIATSCAVAKRVSKVPVRVVHPGVPVGLFSNQSFRESDRSNQIVGTAGRLVALKGVVHLIRAISLLQSDFPGVCLEIAGAGPEERRLKEEVQNLGLSSRVRFLAWQTDMAPVYARWDVFALPSLEEAFGISLVEAMATGLPVVATDVGGIPEIVEHGSTGVLVPPADSAALAHHLGRLLSDPSERKRMGGAGRARAREEFSQESMVSAVEEIYEQLLGGLPVHAGDASAVVV